MYPPKKIVIPEWSLPSYSRRNEIPEVIALVRIRREILAVERQSGIVLYWCKHRVSFIFFFILLLLHIELVLAWLSYIYFYISFFFLSSSSLPSLLSLLLSYLFFLFLFFLANQNGGNYFGGHSREEVAWKILSKYSGEAWKEEAADLQMKQPYDVEELSDVSDFNESGDDIGLQIEGMPEGMELNSNLEVVDKSIRRNMRKKREKKKAKRRQKQHEKKKLKVSTPRNKLVGCSLVLPSDGVGVYQYGQITEVFASNGLLAEVEKHAKMDILVETVSTQKKARGKWRLWKHGGHILKYGDSKEALCLWLLVRIC